MHFEIVSCIAHICHESYCTIKFQKKHKKYTWFHPIRARGVEPRAASNNIGSPVRVQVLYAAQYPSYSLTNDAHWVSNFFEHPT
jgi:hypothetical protein